jgi:glycerol-3-phosphate acyltransferase PlsY
VLVAIDWRLGLVVLGVWLTVVAATRYSSLAAIVAAVAAPLAAWWLDAAGPVLAAVGAMAVLLIVRHRANIAKLLRGEESRIGEKKAMEAKTQA